MADLGPLDVFSAGSKLLGQVSYYTNTLNALELSVKDEK